VFRIELAQVWLTMIRRALVVCCWGTGGGGCSQFNTKLDDFQTSSSELMFFWSRAKRPHKTRATANFTMTATGGGFGFVSGAIICGMWVRQTQAYNTPLISRHATDPHRPDSNVRRRWGTFKGRPFRFYVSVFREPSGYEPLPQPREVSIPDGRRVFHD